MTPGMDQEPDYGDEPIPPPTRAEEQAEAWEHWHEKAHKLEALNAELRALLQELIDIEGPQPGTAEWAEKVRATLAKAGARP